MMQIQVDEQEYCKVMVTYVAEPEKVIEKRAEVLSNIQKQTTDMVVPGFRKGKAPLEAIKIRYRKQIEDALVRELISTAEQDILFETKMKTIFYPQVKSYNLKDARFECQMLFLKRPTVELKQYKGFDIPKPHLPKTQSELVEEMLQQIRTQYGDVAPYGENDFVQMGDKITMDVSCVVDGKQISELTKEGTLYPVGQGFYKEFDDNVVGMSAGETRVFSVLFDAETKQLAEFTVTVHMGIKSVPAPLDDSLAQKLNFESFEKLQNEAEAAASNKIKSLEKSALQDQVTARLMSEHDVKIPEWLVSMDAQQLAMQYKLEWNGLDQQTRTAFEEKARDRVRLTLILEAIRENEPEMNFNSAEMLDVVKTRIAQSGQDPEKAIVELEKTGKLFGMIAALQQEAMFDFLVNNQNIVE